jgi:hypothetical protein
MAFFSLGLCLLAFGFSSACCSLSRLSACGSLSRLSAFGSLLACVDGLLFSWPVYTDLRFLSASFFCPLVTVLSRLLSSMFLFPQSSAFEFSAPFAIFCTVDGKAVVHYFQDAYEVSMGIGFVLVTYIISWIASTICFFVFG